MLPDDCIRSFTTWRAKRYKRVFKSARRSNGIPLAGKIVTKSKDELSKQEFSNLGDSARDLRCGYFEFGGESTPRRSQSHARQPGHSPVANNALSGPSLGLQAGPTPSGPPPGAVPPSQGLGNYPTFRRGATVVPGRRRAEAPAAQLPLRVPGRRRRGAGPSICAGFPFFFGRQAPRTHQPPQPRCCGPARAALAGAGWSTGEANGGRVCQNSHWPARLPSALPNAPLVWLSAGGGFAVPHFGLECSAA
jgi:hypothetical protein